MKCLLIDLTTFNRNRDKFYYFYSIIFTLKKNKQINKREQRNKKLHFNEKLESQQMKRCFSKPRQLVFPLKQFWFFLQKHFYHIKMM